MINIVLTDVGRWIVDTRFDGKKRGGRAKGKDANAMQGAGRMVRGGCADADAVQQTRTGPGGASQTSQTSQTQMCEASR